MMYISMVDGKLGDVEICSIRNRMCNRTSIKQCFWKEVLMNNDPGFRSEALEKWNIQCYFRVVY